MINFVHQGQEYGADNHKSLLCAMKDLNLKSIKAVYTFMGQDAYSRTVSLSDVERLAQEEEEDLER